MSLFPLFLFSLFSLVSSSNVLIWTQTTGQSHVNFMGGLADIIDEDNHNVTILLVRNDPDAVGNGTKKVKNIIRFESDEVDPQDWRLLHWKTSEVFDSFTIHPEDFSRVMDISARICQDMLNDDQFLNTLKKGKFDVVIVEIFDLCPAGIIHQLGIPRIIVASAIGFTPNIYQITQMPQPLSYVPVLMTNLGARQTFFQRVWNLFFHYFSSYLQQKSKENEQKMFEQKYGSEFPNLMEILRDKTDYIFINGNEYTVSTRPLFTNIKYVGGLNIEQKRLNEDFESIFNNSKKGVILLSFGTIVTSMPEHVRSAFTEALSSFSDYEVIWKDEQMNTTFTSPNIHYKEWIPQVDLLADARLKLFITHAGMNSLIESTHFGVPMILMPVFGDQDVNSVVVEERELGRWLDRKGIDRESVEKAVREILEETSEFSRNSLDASYQLREQIEVKRREMLRAVRNSGEGRRLDHLKPEIHHLTTLQYHNIDVYFFFLFLLISTLLVLLFICYCFISAVDSLLADKRKND